MVMSSFKLSRLFLLTSRVKISIITTRNVHTPWKSMSGIEVELENPSSLEIPGWMFDIREVVQREIVELGLSVAQKALYNLI